MAVSPNGNRRIVLRVGIGCTDKFGRLAKQCFTPFEALKAVMAEKTALVSGLLTICE